MKIHPSLQSGFLVLALFCWSVTAPSQALAQAMAEIQQDSKPETVLADYHKAGELSGSLASVGSDSLGNLMVFWAEAFKQLYPSVDINIQSSGSATAPPALAMGSADIGPMSRLMNEQEIQDFETRLGYKPTPFTVAIDALAVLVHLDNPLAGLTMQQLDGIFSANPVCSEVSPVRLWSALGMSGPWSTQAIELFGRKPISGTYQYFKRHVLCDGDFRPDLNELPGSASVVQAVGQSPFGIAYSALGYTNKSVRVLPLASSSGQALVEATRENAVNGSYPLARLLYIYFNHDPAKAWQPLQAEFIRMVLSRQGQQQVARAGFAALPDSVTRRELQKLAQP
ncbi:MAG: phosphate ABC transporter substrate-binding protein [Xanthomonadales bacterium]|nr:phosphate ABC transporter substrate-binding protein [Xanthomonadales bacterium]